jgi:hypothetical protein
MFLPCSVASQNKYCIANASRNSFTITTFQVENLSSSKNRSPLIIPVKMQQFRYQAAGEGTIHGRTLNH